MTNEKLIQLAIEAGFSHSDFQGIHTKHSSGAWVGIDEKLARFAAAVTLRERNRAVHACRMAHKGYVYTANMAGIVAAVTERCAKAIEAGKQP